MDRSGVPVTALAARYIFDQRTDRPGRRCHVALAAQAKNGLSLQASHFRRGRAGADWHRFARSPPFYSACTEYKLTGGEYALYLPCLWYDGGQQTARIRYSYMDVVSRAFSINFSQEIGAWCQEHGVKLIGHIVEDNGAHARLGYGPGHYFRSISGQHAAGLDVVYQIWPEFNTSKFTTPFGYLEADFFYWGITKMASSAGHIDQKKQGVTVCEVFGAYGW